MRDYLDADMEWSEYTTRRAELTRDAARFVAKAARKKAIKAETFDSTRLRRYALRPFETRWCYYTPVRPLWNEPRPALWRHHFRGNAFLMTRPAGVSDPEGVPFGFTRCLGDNDYQRGHSYYFPMLLAEHKEDDGERLIDLTRPGANLSKMARAYLARLRVPDPDADTSVARLVWMHVLAIGYSPAYLAEHADGIRRDWPRIPLPATREALLASAALGERVAALLDTEAEVAGVTADKVASIFKMIGAIAKVGGGRLDPSGDALAVTVNWGYLQGSAVMPGAGRLTSRANQEDEARIVEEQAAAMGIPPDAVRRLLGDSTFDVYLNDIAYWRNIPANVWEYRIGGYQVIKKWLSYRELPLLGRPLKTDEVREVTKMAQRIAAIILLQPELDDNYRRVKVAAFDWSSA